MDLSKRLILVKSPAKEEDYPAFTPYDVIFLFGDITHPEGLILNHSDPSECFVLFAQTAPMNEIYGLNKEPSWVGAPMLLSVRQPSTSIYNIVNKLLENKTLEEGEAYELIPIEPEEKKGAEGPQPHSTPKSKAEPLATVLAEQLKQLESQELHKILSAIQTEMKSRQDVSTSPAHEVSSILHNLLKDGALRTNIPRLSAFSGERTKGEVSFEQWSYELQTRRKTYSDSALREGIQCSLRGAAAYTVRNLGSDVPLDTIIKKFTIVYGNVKSFDLLMWDFYHADQGEEGSIPSFATWVEGLLSQIHDRLPEKLTHPEKQRLLKDCLFHRCKKSIWDSVKYCFADPHIKYMHFLEECCKAEDEDKVGQAKAGQPKAKVEAATIPPTREDDLANQFKYQQHQIDTLVGQVKNLVSAVKSMRASSRGAMTGGPGIHAQNTWRGGSRGRGLPAHSPLNHSLA